MASINNFEIMQDIIQLLTANWAMSIALVIVLSLILLNDLHHMRNKGKEVTPHEAVRLINHEDAVIIDIRDTASYQKSHIIDALFASSDDFSQEKMARYKDKNIIVVCQKGIQASALVPKLQQQGFNKSFVLAGGMTAWQDAQLPVSKGK